MSNTTNHSANANSRYAIPLEILFANCSAAQLRHQRKSDKPVRHVVICFCGAHSSRAGRVQWEAERRERERKLGVLKGKLLLRRGRSARVITQRAEENQERTLCRPDKQAACIGKQCTHGLQPAGPALLQAPGLHAVISTLPKCAYMFGQRRPGGNKGKSWRQHSAEAGWPPGVSATFSLFGPGRKCDFTTNRCGVVTPLAGGPLRTTRCVHRTAPLENDSSGHTEHRVSPAPTTHSLVLGGISLLACYQYIPVFSLF